MESHAGADDVVPHDERDRSPLRDGRPGDTVEEGHGLDWRRGDPLAEVYHANQRSNEDVPGATRRGMTPDDADTPCDTSRGDAASG